MVHVVILMEVLQLEFMIKVIHMAVNNKVDMLKSLLNPMMQHLDVVKKLI
jgi:hypothetical protein